MADFCVYTTCPQDCMRMTVDGHAMRREGECPTPTPTPVPVTPVPWPTPMPTPTRAPAHFCGDGVCDMGDYTTIAPYFFRNNCQVTNCPQDCPDLPTSEINCEMDCDAFCTGGYDVTLRHVTEEQCRPQTVSCPGNGNLFMPGDPALIYGTWGASNWRSDCNCWWCAYRIYESIGGCCCMKSVQGSDCVEDLNGWCDARKPHGVYP